MNTLYNHNMKKESPIVPLTQEQQKLAADNIRLVRSALNRVKYRKEYEEDLISIGYQAICKATQTFDPTLDIKFSTYATNGAYWAMVSAIRTEHRNQHSDTLDDPNEEFGTLSDNLVSNDVDLDEQMDAKRLWDMLAKLPDNLATVVKGRYEGKTTRELATELGVTNTTVSNWQNRGTQMLKQMVGVA